MRCGLPTMTAQTIIDDEYLQTQHENIYNSYDECNIGIWYPRMSKHPHTTPTCIVPLSIEDIEALVVFGQYFRNYVDEINPDQYNVIDRNFSVLNNCTHKYGEAFRWTKLNASSFIGYKRKLKMIQYKLNTFMTQFTSLKDSKAVAFVPRLSIDMKIPTDALYPSTTIYHNFEYCLKHNLHRHQSPLTLLSEYHRACWKSMEFKNATDVIELMLRSEFMLRELNKAHCRLSDTKEATNCSLLLQMIPYQSIEHILEFRMFISSHHPIAITQYQSFINHENDMPFILPMSAATMKRWNQILDTDCLQDSIKSVLMTEYEQIRKQLNFTKCNNYCMDLMIINTVDNEYEVRVMSINRQPLYRYQYGLLSYFEDIQSKHVSLTFEPNKIPKVSVVLAVEDAANSAHLKIEHILPQEVIQYLYLHGWILPCNLKQLWYFVLWNNVFINKIVSRLWSFMDKWLELWLKCWHYVHDICGFGWTEVFYMCCGGLITLWIEYVMSNSPVVQNCSNFIQMVLTEMVLPVMLGMLGISFVLGFVFTLLSLLIFHSNICC
eukprot:93168_1